MRSRNTRTTPITLKWVAFLCLAGLILTFSGCNHSDGTQGRVIGTVTVGGRPAEGVTVTVFTLARAVNDKDASLLVQGAVVQEASTAPDGVYECSLSAGKYLVMPAGYKGTSRLVEIKPGGTSRADFQLPP